MLWCTTIYFNRSPCCVVIVILKHITITITSITTMFNIITVIAITITIMIITSILIVITTITPCSPPRRGAQSKAPRSRTNGVNANGAAAKVMSFDRLGEKVCPGTLGKTKVA